MPDLDNLDNLENLDVVKLSLECSTLYFKPTYKLAVEQTQLAPEVMSKVIAACKIEALRQHVGLTQLENLVKAYITAKRELDASFNSGFYLTPALLTTIAVMIEPVKAAAFRKTPASFSNGSLGLHPQLIESSMSDLLAHQKLLTADEFVKEFLLIHPYSDGNGRTAFVLYNLLNSKRWDTDMWNPKQLPAYFDEE